MRFEGLDLNLLVVLNDLFETQSVSQTADRLNVSQPTISAALIRLREFFGDELLTNVGRRMIPTPKGRSLLPAVEEVLNLTRFRIIQRNEFNPSTESRCFKLIASDYVFDVLLAQVLARASKLAPHIEFEVLPLGPQSISLFEKGEVDLMITVSEFLLENHPTTELFKDEDKVICGANGRYGKRLSKSEFLNGRFAKNVFGPEGRSTVSELFFESKGITLDAAITVRNFSALAQVVIDSDLLAVMHGKHTAFFARRFPITIHDLPVEGPVIKQVAQWHRLREHDEGILWLLDLLRQAVTEFDAHSGDGSNSRQ